MRSPASALPPEFLRQVTRDEVNALPVGRYEGEVVLVETRDAFDRAWEDLAREAWVGWDTETRPAFRVGESYAPSLVQAATARAVYLFPLARMDFSKVVGGLFAEPTIVKAGISVADDLKKLKEVFPFEEASVLDLGTVAKRHGMKQTGLRNLAGVFLGFRVTKGAKTTNWAAPRLSAQQISYAATDAWACRELCLKFRALGML
ncbi:MAG TPA: 3'-5' exonuclease [Burkholderiales bacterium]|jgi:ribonuclease D|nr:3'-5' exonuclease [Burkholderiales bacterium]